jgi:hypothetical protein
MVDIEIHKWIVEYTEKNLPSLPPLCGDIADKSKGEIGFKDFVESLAFDNQTQDQTTPA